MPGNDDYGTMSGYIMFTTLGFYPQAGNSFIIIAVERKFWLQDFEIIVLQ